MANAGPLPTRCRRNNRLGRLLFGIGPYATLDALTETGVFPREGVGFQTLTSTRFTTR